MAIETAPDMRLYGDFIRWLEQRVEGFVQPKSTMKDKLGTHREYYVATGVRMQWLVRDYPDEWVAFITARRLAGDKYIGK